MPQVILAVISVASLVASFFIPSGNQQTTPPATEPVTTFDIQGFLLAIGIAGAIALVAYLLFRRKGKK